MASVLAAVLDDMRAIISGSSTSSPIDAGRYVAVEYDPSTLLPASAYRPYPFEIEVGSRGRPTEYPVNASGDYAYYSREVVVRVMYARQPHETEDQQDAVVTDEDEIALALEDPASWSASGFVAYDLADSDLFSIDDEDVEIATVLQIRGEIIYRESRP